MACEYFLGGAYPLCTVVQGLMCPSLWEMRTYCTSDRPSACLLYQQHAASREKVPVETAMVLIDATAPRLPGLRVENDSCIREPFLAEGSPSVRRSRFNLR